MVPLYVELLICPIRAVTPSLQSIDNWQEAPVVCVVVLFRTFLKLRTAVDWPENPKTLQLVENAGDCNATCLSLKCIQLSLFQMLGHGSIGEGTYQLLELQFNIPSQCPLELFRLSGMVCYLWWVRYWHCFPFRAPGDSPRIALWTQEAPAHRPGTPGLLTPSFMICSLIPWLSHQGWVIDTMHQIYYLRAFWCMHDY